MILKRLYLTPNSPFGVITFKPGINFIFGKKEVTEGNEKQSLNAIGKSTFLDLIDFAFLSSFTKRNNKRLFAAYTKGLLKEKTVILEFQVDSKSYVIKRSFDEHQKASLSELKNSKEFFENIDDVKASLCDLIFKRSDYPGYYSNKWLRKLMPFYIKIKKTKKDTFADPIGYIRESTTVELNQYHFFLLNINNSISNRNFQIQTDLKRLTPTIKEVGNFINSSYNVNDISDAQKKINALQAEIEKLEQSINLFRLSYKYKIDEKKANKLTEDIKQLWFENNSDQKKIDNYRDSLKLDISVRTANIKKLYEEFNQLMADNIKRTLDEAIEFRKSLVESRKDFIDEEIKTLEETIKQRNETISQKEEERAKIFRLLAAQEAITDLTEAYSDLDRKRGEAADLQGKIQLYLDLSEEKSQIKQEESKIEGEIYGFKKSIQKQEYEFAAKLISIYNELYPEINEPSAFSIDLKPETNSKIEFSVLTNNEMLSEGKGRGRIIVYDLSVLFYSLEKNYKAPQFLNHDGVFDGMDKSHFIQLYKYLNEQLMEGKEFQYIVTLNEEGTLSDKFGEAELVTPEKIADEAILILTPNKKLLGKF